MEDLTHDRMQDEPIGELSEHEIEWVTSQLALASRLALQYTGKRERLPPPETLDGVLSAWLERLPGEREDVDTIVNALGLAFGQNLVERHGLEWAVLTDQQRTEIALHGQPGDVRVFPTRLTAGSLERGEAAFFASLFKRIGDDISRARGRVVSDGPAGE